MPSPVSTATSASTTDDNGETDVKWTDAQIRWPEDEVKKNGESEEEDEDEEINPFDPFADPDPTEIFSFRFVTKPRKEKSPTTESIEGADDTNNDAEDDESNTIHLNIHGYKTGSDQVWESTGLTLWKASKYLCDYMVQHADELRGQRVLELGAGLGLNGVLAHRLGADSVVITDGDSDAMVELRKNIVVNRVQNDDNEKTDTILPHRALSAAQLIWGEDSAKVFLKKETAAADAALKTEADAPSSKFSIILASDVIYASIVIDPLFETVRTLLRKPSGEFWMAFAVRKVPVTIDFVLNKAKEHGFRYELVDKQQEGDDDKNDSDGGGYGVEDDPETGPVFVYRFQWDTDSEEES